MMEVTIVINTSSRNFLFKDPSDAAAIMKAVKNHIAITEIIVANRAVTVDLKIKKGIAGRSIPKINEIETHKADLNSFSINPLKRNFI